MCDWMEYKLTGRNIGVLGVRGMLGFTARSLGHFKVHRLETSLGDLTCSAAEAGDGQLDRASGCLLDCFKASEAKMPMLGHLPVDFV